MLTLPSILPLLLSTHSNWQTLIHLWVFDRWGKVVFHSEDYQNDWDGTYPNGQRAAPGVYTWKITYRNSPTSNGERDRYGTVTIVPWDGGKEISLKGLKFRVDKLSLISRTLRVFAPAIAADTPQVRRWAVAAGCRRPKKPGSQHLPPPARRRGVVAESANRRPH
jgi:hypothetical protein